MIYDSYKLVRYTQIKIVYGFGIIKHKYYEKSPRQKYAFAL